MKQRPEPYVFFAAWWQGLRRIYKTCRANNTLYGQEHVVGGLVRTSLNFDVCHAWLTTLSNSDWWWSWQITFVSYIRHIIRLTLGLCLLIGFGATEIVNCWTSYCSLFKRLINTVSFLAAPIFPGNIAVKSLFIKFTNATPSTRLSVKINTKVSENL